MKKFLFFRNPIFFNFAKKANFMRFVCLKKCLFLIIYFKSLAIPIKLNLKYFNHLKKKKVFKRFCRYSNFFIKFNVKEEISWNKIKLKLIKKYSLDICKKKVLNLIFKNCLNVNRNSADLVEHLFFNLKVLFKFKLYENLKKGILNIKLVKRFFGKLPIEIKTQ